MEDNCLNKKVMTAIIWVMLFVAIIFMVSGLNPSENKPDELDYNTDFLQLVRNTESGAATGETIKAIQVNQREVYGLYGDSAYDPEDLPKKSDFYVVIPSESTFRTDMSAIVYAANPSRYTSVDEVSSADYSFAYESKIDICGVRRFLLFPDSCAERRQADDELRQIPCAAADGR
jgi:hypothetical protein